jgi:alanine dehydrogenase
MRNQTLILTQRDVARLIDMQTAIRVTQESFIAMARGEAVMPPKIYLPLPRESDFRAMPAFLEHPASCGVKWVNVHPGNPARGLSSVMAIIIMNDPATGFPLAVMDGLLITKLRTAAAAAVAAKVLARPNSRVVGLIGCGAQADAQLLALKEVLQIFRVHVWGSLAGEAARFCKRMRRQMAQTTLIASPSVEACVKEADLIVTLTPSRRALVKRAWVSPGTHINAVGADAPGKQELDFKILRDATVVVDDRAQAIHGGEINVPIRRGQFHPRKIHASLGEILVGRKRSRQSDAEITLFDSTGLAIHDVALGAKIVRQARRLRLGQRVKFFD